MTAMNSVDFLRTRGKNVLLLFKLKVNKDVKRGKCMQILFCKERKHAHMLTFTPSAGLGVGHEQSVNHGEYDEVTCSHALNLTYSHAHMLSCSLTPSGCWS